jgi:HK97 family phage major capsid protein
MKKIVGFIGLALFGALAVSCLDHLSMAFGVLHLVAGGLALATAPLAFTEEQVRQFQETLGEFKHAWTRLKPVPDTIQTLEADQKRLRADLEEIRRISAARRHDSVTLRRPGFVSLACAEYLGAAMIIGNARSGRLDTLDSHVRSVLFDRANRIMGLEARAALTGTDVPLPVTYFSELRELISDFGVVRRRMFPFPIGHGTAKPPRFKTRPTFGSIAMSATVAEKSPQIDFATLESHKVGGLVRVPRELDEQSIVPMGQFLARYGAIEFARAEDVWGFLADGTASYENVKGICKVASDNSRVLTLATGKTKPSDATRADFRNLRAKVTKAALSGTRAAYYLDSTWEIALRDMNDASQPYFFVIQPDGSARIDGYPVVWTDVLTPYGTTTSAASYLAVFGALDFWWFGEHGQPRMDFSGDVFFGTDELATRFIEEIDFDYQQADVTAALMTAAS